MVSAETYTFSVPIPGFGFLVVGGIVALVLYVRWRTADSRRREMARLARSQGWTWDDGDDTVAHRLTGTPFGVGQHRRVGSVVTGPYAGRQIAVFDYSYTAGQSGGYSAVEHDFTVLTIKLPTILPAVSVGPPQPLDGRIGRALGMGDLQLESEDFNRAFHVETADPRFGTAILHPRMMSYLLGTGAWPWRFESRYLVSYFPQTAAPMAILGRLDLMIGLVERIPAYVWTDARGGRPRAEGDGGWTPR